MNELTVYTTTFPLIVFDAETCAIEMRWCFEREDSWMRWTCIRRPRYGLRHSANTWRQAPIAQDRKRRKTELEVSQKSPSWSAEA